MRTAAHAGPLESPYTLRRLPEGLESVDGPLLSARMAACESLPELEALRYALHVASSLLEAHGKGVGHGGLRADSIVLERLERHCCEAEKFRAKLTYPAQPPSWSGTLQASDIAAFGSLFAALLGNPAVPAGEDEHAPLRRLAQACAGGRFRSMRQVLRQLERYVERRAFAKLTVTRWLAAFGLDALAIAAVFWRSPVIALLVWLVYDTGTRFAVQRTLGERLCGLPPDRSVHNLLFRLVLFATFAGTSLWLILPTTG